MGVQQREKAPLVGGFYTLQEVARLLDIDSTQRIRGWLAGYQNRAEAIIIRQYGAGTTVQDVGFWDLLEIRFIEHFRKQGVSLQSIRRAAQAARAELKRDHPFAMSSVKFMTDRKRIFLHTAEETQDQKLLDLTRGQYAMYEMIEQLLAKGVSFDPSTGLAEQWHPRPSEFPHIVLNPKFAFGQPVVEPNRVPTAALFKLWKAENGDYDAVSDWYEVDKPLAQEAIEFEMALAA